MSEYIEIVCEDCNGEGGWEDDKYIEVFTCEGCKGYGTIGVELPLILDPYHGDTFPPEDVQKVCQLFREGEQDES